ncbi:MAG: hypothetical protein L3J45_00960 [Flavobacteriaceae bacterium]|nr:hypothetical protein [Flavobacteriaceae bacterium]
MFNIWLLGGFGNVLFQILTGRILKKEGLDVVYINNLTEKNCITKFIGWTIHQPLYLDLLKNERLISKNLFKSSLIILIAAISKFFNSKFKFANFYSDSVRFKRPYSENIFGYFQEKYFLNTYKREVLELGQELRKLYGTNTENIIVHYRKGDSGWAKSSSEYYNKVRDLIRDEPSKVFIVTDSPKEADFFFLNLDNIQILNSKNALDDFKILLSAKKLYCAPSTFSWWAAHALDINAKIIMPNFLEAYLGIFVNKNNIQIIKS